MTALVSGNTVLAKPSTQTPVIANFATLLMHRAGVPKSVLQLVITSSSNISKIVVADERIAGVVFTGSYSAAQSIFYSAGQRCSALRMLYVQEEIYDDLLEMIKGATELLKIGDTADFSMDIGPVIDKKAQDALEQHIQGMSTKVLKYLLTHRMGL